MSPRRILILGVVAVLVLAAGLWLASRETSTSGSHAYGALYPELKRHLDAVTAVRIFTTGDKRAVELLRGAAGWTVSERNGHAADEPKLRKLLIALAQAKLSEEKTANPAQYATLGVEDITAASAGSTRIELAGVTPPVNLLVGKPAPGGTTLYVRRVGEPQSWLIDTSIDTSATPDAWLRREILDISADRVQSATVSVKGAKSYTLAKQARADAGFSAEGLPKGKALSSSAAADVVATALTGLTLSDVQPASAFAEAPAAHTTFKTFDGLVVEVDGWQRDEKHFIAVKTSFDPAQAERFKVAAAPAPSATPAADAQPAGAQGAAEEAAPKPDAKPAAGAAKPAEAAAAPSVADQANKDAARLAGWVYEVPDYKYQGLFKPVEELF